MIRSTSESPSSDKVMMLLGTPLTPPRDSVLVLTRSPFFISLDARPEFFVPATYSMIEALDHPHLYTQSSAKCIFSVPRSLGDFPLSFSDLDFRAFSS